MNLKKLARKQPSSRRVVLASLPCIAGGVYFFGWRSLAMVALACAVGFAAEWMFCRRRKEPVSEAVFVTAILFALILPPTVPWHVLVVGMLVAIIFAKEVFGGFGRNVFNPAIAGRCFVYVCFPVAMTAMWAPNVWDLPETAWYGALDRWTPRHVSTDPGRRPDGHTGASPGGAVKARQLALQRQQRAGAPAAEIRQAEQQVAEARPGLGQLFWGNVSGTMGVTSSLLILLGGMYLLVTKTANRTIVLSVILSCAAFSQTLYWLGVRPGSDAPRALLSGGFLFGAFFMATDPVSAAKTFEGRIIYGCIIGVGRVVIQNFSVFNGGFMFSLLLANMFAPTIDALVRELKRRSKARADEAGAGEAEPA